MHFVIMKVLANNINGLFCNNSLLFTLEDEYGGLSYIQYSHLINFTPKFCGQ